MNHFGQPASTNASFRPSPVGGNTFNSSRNGTPSSFSPEQLNYLRQLQAAQNNAGVRTAPTTTCSQPNIFSGPPSASPYSGPPLRPTPINLGQPTTNASTFVPPGRRFPGPSTPSRNFGTTTNNLSQDHPLAGLFGPKNSTNHTTAAPTGYPGMNTPQTSNPGIRRTQTPFDPSVPGFSAVPRTATPPTTGVASDPNPGFGAYSTPQTSVPSFVDETDPTNHGAAWMRLLQNANPDQLRSTCLELLSSNQGLSKKYADLETKYDALQTQVEELQTANSTKNTSNRPNLLRRLRRRGKRVTEGDGGTLSGTSGSGYNTSDFESDEEETPVENTAVRRPFWKRSSFRTGEEEVPFENTRSGRRFGNGDRPRGSTWDTRPGRVGDNGHRVGLDDWNPEAPRRGQRGGDPWRAPKTGSSNRFFD